MSRTFLIRWKKRWKKKILKKLIKHRKSSKRYKSKEIPMKFKKKSKSLNQNPKSQVFAQKLPFET
jgi:hypothetical protein